MDIAIIFQTMMKGVIISANSKKYGDMATFLYNDGNYAKYEDILYNLGYELNGQNGYYYLSKSDTLSSDEIEQFVRSHKEVFLLISILKHILPHTRTGLTIRYTEFIANLDSKNDEALQEKWHYIFGKVDLKNSTEKFFERLEKEFLIEKIDKEDGDSYLVLHSLEYYLSFLENLE